MGDQDCPRRLEPKSLSEGRRARVRGPASWSSTIKPPATAEVLRDGWLYTGDMARMDEHGFIYLVDRKDVIIFQVARIFYPVR